MTDYSEREVHSYAGQIALAALTYGYIEGLNLVVTRYAEYLPDEIRAELTAQNQATRRFLKTIESADL